MSTSISVGPRSQPNVPGPRKIGWADLAWLVWRQHRGIMLALAALAATTTACLLWVNARMPHTPCPENSGCWETVHHYERFAQALLVAAFGLPFFVAVFMAAPLLAREYEQRTNLLAWSQDVPLTRWLLARVVLLGLTSAALIAVTSSASNALLHTIQTNAAGDAFNDPWDTLSFEASAPLVVAYTIAGLGIGIGAGALVKRVVPAMGLSLAVFIALRLALQHVRLRLIPPLHRSVPIETWFAPIDRGPSSDYSFGSQWVNVAGQPVDPTSCFEIPTSVPPAESTDVARCLTDAGVTHLRESYQPLERLEALRLVEAGLFLAVGLIAIALAVYLLDRRQSLS